MFICLHQTRTKPRDELIKTESNIRPRQLQVILLNTNEIYQPQKYYPRCHQMRLPHATRQNKVSCCSFCKHWPIFYSCRSNKRKWLLQPWGYPAPGHSCCYEAATSHEKTHTRQLIHIQQLFKCSHAVYHYLHVSCQAITHAFKFIIVSVML